MALISNAIWKQGQPLGITVYAIYCIAVRVDGDLALTWAMDVFAFYASVLEVAIDAGMPQSLALFALMYFLFFRDSHFTTWYSRVLILASSVMELSFVTCITKLY